MSSQKDLQKVISKKENILKFIKGELGNNLMFKYKSLSLTKYAKDMFKMVNEVTIEFLKKRKSYESFY